ncbi:PQQ-like beta-propeller repeat protein [Pendulispora rubella]|uniref:PQQ-like beta-propeller repeat protein n=1 Tax=Pendulispora rubella TaxID=2741070 RepID=A0ABZ2LDL0_9BACT
MMRSFEILVASDEIAPAFDPESTNPSPHPKRRRGAREVLDIFIGGVNVTARVADRQAPAVLRDLGLSLARLARQRRGKILVRFYDDPWELCVERMGKVAALSVYRTGADPFVVAYDERASFAEIHARVREAVKKAIERGSAPAAVAVELRAAEAALDAVDPEDLTLEDDPLSALTPVSVEVERDFPVALGTEFILRKFSDAEDDAAPVERADLHALLFRGRIRAEVRGRAVDLGEGHPFLFAERLLAMSADALQAWEHGQPQYVRAEAGGVLIAVRLSTDGDAALTLGSATRAPEQSFTFPALSVSDLVEASLAFGRALSRAVLRRDRAQCTNLRLSAFRRQLRETADCLRDVCRDDAKTNPTPEPYRAFVAASRPSRSPEVQGTSQAPPARLRYSERWRALVPGIDLRATFLCGDRVIASAAAETFCLDRTSGNVLWRVPTTRATSVVTPGGLARISGDGEIRVHDFGNGEVTMRAQIDPRLGAPPAGAVVSLPGLPRLLIVTEGERHLSAIDLTNGEPRWRFTWGRGGALRMRRAGRLLYIASGDSALTAVDVQSGSVVWRVRNRLRFRSSPTLDHDVLMAVAGGANSAAELLAIDPYSGDVRFQCPIAPSAATVEGGPLIAGRVVACAVRMRHGLRLAAFCRETGRELWKSEGSVAPVGTSWLAVDGLFIGNCPTGELVAVEAESGALRYRHVLGRMVDSDVPRRLEPVLRSGALFVPHTDVHVFRPHDGTEIATIGPCDAIPDLLRVDEQCNVYVAEESGHLVSFAVGPRLTLVKG